MSSRGRHRHVGPRDAATDAVASQLRAQVLLDTELALIRDVVCTARAGGCGPKEQSVVAQVIVPRRGVFMIHHGKEEIVVDTTTALFVVPEQEHRVSHPADGGDACTVLSFADHLTEEALGLRRGRHGALAARTQLVVRMLASALASRREAGELEAVEASVLVLGALAEDLRVTPAVSTGALAHRRVHDVRTLLASAPTRTWRLQTIAREVHCSPFHLARQFRAMTGKTISGQLLRLRLGIALDRVADGESALAKLAVELGFAHHSHFTERFRAVFGVTPARVRDRCTKAELQDLRKILTASRGTEI
jgi:AraC-like DNA-binding protein